MTLALLHAGNQTSGVPSRTADQVPGLQAWFDSSVGASITITTGVSAWASQVGAFSASQATGANQPANGAVMAGKNALLFDGTNDSLATASATILNWTTDKLSVFAAIKTPASFSGTSTIMSKASNPDTGSDGTKWAFKIDATGHLQGAIGTSTIVTATSTFPLSVSTRYIVRMVYDGTNISLATNSNTAETTAQTGNLISNISTFTKIGRGQYDSDYYKGTLGELALYDAAVSGNDLLGLMNGLVAKWVTPPDSNAGLAMGIFGLTYAN